jgi:hypothetical protein
VAARAVAATRVSAAARVAAGVIATEAAAAATAAAKAFSAVVGIPIIGPALAPLAAAGAFAGAMAFGIPSASGGWGEVPQDGLAMIHKKEMVLPAPIAETVRNMANNSMSNNNSSTSNSSGHTFNFNISALDGNSVKDMFTKPGGVIINSINIKQTLPEQLTVEVNFSPIYNPALTRIKSIQV